MRYGIGIDTGGTYTDAVLYCFDTRAVVAKAKALTDRGNLSRSIDSALHGLPEARFAEVSSVAISTTLATNACVEGKGGRAHLLLVGASEKLLQKVDAARRYGLSAEDVLCVDGRATFDGKAAEQVDWDAVVTAHPDFFREADALCVAAMNAVRNGGIHEIAAQEALSSRFPVPFVRAGELADGLNVFERGATALLNARLLPLIREFMDSVQTQLDQRGIACKYMTVRSDGSLMGQDTALRKPVETILSGPAASVIGAKALAGCPDCLVVDIGGTTTDIAVIQNGRPAATDQIEIGGWRTQIRGVSIDTFALGGDSRFWIKGGSLALDTRRVKPLCALAVEHPEIVGHLQALVDLRRQHSLPIYEFLQLIRPDVDERRYNAAENDLIRALRNGPVMLGGGAVDLYGLDSERLENEGVILRCGLTPTDILHVTGDFTAFDARAARLAVRYFLHNLQQYDDDEAGLRAFCADALERFRHQLFRHIAATLLKHSYPEIFRGVPDEQFSRYIEHLWKGDDAAGRLCHLALTPQVKLIGIGAPTHAFLPDVAARLGMECIIPADADVANAVGAVVAGVNASVVVAVRPDVEGGFSLHGPGRSAHFDEYEDALAAAREEAEALAREKGRALGADRVLRVQVETMRHTGHTKFGDAVDLGTDVIATASEDDARES